jgi:hypothetical protein
MAQPPLLENGGEWGRLATNLFHVRFRGLLPNLPNLRQFAALSNQTPVA